MVMWSCSVTWTCMNSEIKSYAYTIPKHEENDDISTLESLLSESGLELKYLF